MSIMNFYTKRTSLLFLLLTLLTLHGCGGSRDEPFNAGNVDDDDEDEETGASISLIIEHSADEPLRLSSENQSRMLQVIRDEDEYIDILNNYVDVASTSEPPDFDAGQVILHDAGVQKVCARRLELSGESAEEKVGNDNVALVHFTYREKAAVAEANCTDSTATIRPFKFFYIKTRRDIIFDEDLK